MNQSLGTKLRKALDKIKASIGSTKERNIAFAEADIVVAEINEALTKKRTNTPDKDRVLIRLLASIDKGSMFPGMRNYIRHPQEFDAAVDELRNMYGDIEEIKL